MQGTNLTAKLQANQDITVILQNETNLAAYIYTDGALPTDNDQYAYGCICIKRTLPYGVYTNTSNGSTPYWFAVQISPTDPFLLTGTAGIVRATGTQQASTIPDGTVGQVLSIGVSGYEWANAGAGDVTQVGNNAFSGVNTHTGTEDFTGATLIGIDKVTVGLSNVDNTSDINKPISTATAASLSTKFTNSVTTARLLGRSSAGTGVAEEIILGTNLSLSGSTLNATAITSLGGQTGSTQTFGNDTNVTMVSTLNNHTLTWSGILSEIRGGTGNGSYTTGDMLYATSATTLARRAIGSNGQFLSVVGGVPTWITQTTTGVQSINGNSTNAQIITSGATGSDVGVSSSAGTTTISIPVASNTVTGKLSNTDWITFNAKLSSTLAAGTILIGNISNVATAVTPSGDVTFSNSGVTSLSSVGSAGTYGSTTQLPILTTDSKGRVTGVTLSNINHNGLLNYVANEHVNHTSVALTAGTGITSTGLGDLTATRTINVDIANTANRQAQTANKMLDASSIIDEDTMISDSDSRIPTQQSVKAYVDNKVTGALKYRGLLAGTSDLRTITTGNAYWDTTTPLVAGSFFEISTSGTLTTNSGTVVVEAGDNIFLNQDTTPGTITSTMIDLIEGNDNILSVFGRTGNVIAVSGDYTASLVTNTPAGNISATTVQAAINELDSEKQTVTLADGNILIGNAANVSVSNTVTGDITITNTGFTSIGTDKVTTTKIINDAVTTAKILDGNVTNAKLANSGIALAVASTGSDVAFTTASAALGGTATLEVPNASAIARGVISTGTQTLAGIKTFNDAGTTFAAGTTTRASIRIPTGVAPTTPVAGDIWVQSDSSTQKSAGSTGLVMSNSTTIFKQTATGSGGASSVVAYTVSSTGIGTLTIPANTLQVGDTIRIQGWGTHTLGAGTLTTSVLFGATNVATSGAIASGAAATPEATFIDVLVTIRTTGAAGTYIARGYIEFLSNTVKFPMGLITTGTLNTTISNAISVTNQWGTSNASNNTTLSNLTVEIL